VRRRRCLSFLSLGSSDLGAKRRAGAVFDADSWRHLPTWRPGGSRARTEGAGHRAKSPRTGETIDPMRAKTLRPLKKPEPVSSFWSSGPAPALRASRVSHDLCLLSLIPSFSPREAAAAAFRRRARRLPSSDRSLCHSSGFLSSNSENIVGAYSVSCWSGHCRLRPDPPSSWPGRAHGCPARFVLE
jgi:hypothetical protein